MEKSLLILNTSTGSFLIDINTIVRIEASSNYSKIYFSAAMDGSKTLVTAPGCVRSLSVRGVLSRVVTDP